ncbi:MAG: metallophosphoesterase family protein [Nitrospira sp.]|nr:metallophosphoesterase family protein [Nitrospira sp.]
MNEQWTIEILGSVGGATCYSPEQIGAVLVEDQTQLAHGEQFTGRPVTKLHVGKRDVVKLRPEAYRNKTASVVAVARQALERERTYRVHHPDKTWFVIHVASETTPVIGNICPLLTPLHTLLAKNPQGKKDSDGAVELLMCLCRLYFKTIKAHTVRLDEGLSNFGISADHELYYIDDDLYPWDECVTFAHTLGMYFRSLPWLTPELAGRFGNDLRKLILDVYPNGQYIYVLSGQLGDVFMPAEDRRLAFESFKEAFDRRKAERRPVEFEEAEVFAVLADIHANLPALERVLSYLKEERIAHGIVLGDIVGYGPHPAECVERVQATGFATLQGNHDYLASEGKVPDGSAVTSHARWALDWTAGHLKEPHKQWLAALPPILQGAGWFAVHGAPIDPTFMNAYVYHMTYESNLDLLERRQLPVCFHGHTHIPAVYARKRGVPDKCYTEDVQHLGDYRHALVCPGSVGQTREGNASVRFATYERGSKTLRLHRLDYDVDRTAADMTSHGFPATLIERLRRGH